jgi:starvation-inducible DNA-binding protein
VKFEELYTDLQLKIDEIAERIVTLGGTPLHTFSGFTEHATIHAVAHVSDGRSAMLNILDSMKVVIEIQRSILTLSADADDEGTNALMSDYIRAQEKLVWMYSAYLG